MYVKDVNGSIEMNYTRVYDDITALVILHIMEQNLMHVDQGTVVGDYHDFLYEMINSFNITRVRARDKLGECMSLTAQIFCQRQGLSKSAGSHFLSSNGGRFMGRRPCSVLFALIIPLPILMNSAICSRICVI